MAKERVRVIVVDDSAVFRELFSSILGRNPHIEVVATAVDAFDAREKIKKYDPDVITLDVEMPGMSGLEFLQKIMSLRPFPVIMCSSYTREGADAAVQALSMGAVGVCAKPKLTNKAEVAEFTRFLCNKIIGAAVASPKSSYGNPEHSAIARHPKTRRYPKLVAIGASTGGPGALERLVTELPADGPPVVVALHMAPGFSDAYARRLASLSQIQVKEAEDNEAIKDGCVYIAPSDRNMRVVSSNGERFCNIIEKDPSSAKHTPSVDTLFQSLCSLPSRELVAIMMTGMGNDGAEAMLKLHASGVHTIVQDQDSCVVYGMPKCVIELGAANEIVALDDIAHRLLVAAY